MVSFWVKPSFSTLYWVFPPQESFWLHVATLLKNYSGCKLHYDSRIFTPRCTPPYKYSLHVALKNIHLNISVTSLLLPSTHRNNWNSTGCWILLCAQCRCTWNILKNKIIFSLIDWRKPHPVWLKNILPDGCKNIHSMLHFSLVLKNILNPLSYFLQHTETTELNCLLPAACPDSCRLYTATGWLE